MPGLYDAFEDPQNAGLLTAAAQMLALSGPSRTPTSFGQILGSGLLGGMQAYSSAKKLKLDQEKEQMQMDLLKQQVAQATRKNGLMTDMLQQYLGGGSDIASASSALGEGAKVGDIGPTVSNAARMNGLRQQASPLAGVPREAIAHDLAFNDGKNISEWLFKRGTPDMQVNNGYAYDKNSVKPGFLPSLSVSQNGQATITMPGPDGMPIVTAPQGALATYGAYKDADEASRARYDIVKATDYPGEARSRLDVINGARGGAAPAPAGGQLPGMGAASPSAAPAPWDNIVSPAERDQMRSRTFDLENKRLDDLREAVRKSRTIMSDLNRFGELNRNTATGSWADASGWIPTTDSDKREMEAIVSRLGPNLRVAGSGSDSDLEQRQRLKALPGIDKPGDVNKNIRLGYEEQQRDLESELAFKEAYLSEHGHLNGADVGRTQAIENGKSGGLDVSKLTPEQRAMLQQLNPDAFDRGVARFAKNGSPQGAANVAGKPKSQFFKLDGGGSVAAKLEADGNYYVVRNGKKYRVEE